MIRYATGVAIACLALFADDRVCHIVMWNFDKDMRRDLGEYPMLSFWVAAVHISLIGVPRTYILMFTCDFHGIYVWMCKSTLCGAKMC